MIYEFIRVSSKVFFATETAYFGLIILIWAMFIIMCFTTVSANLLIRIAGLGCVPIIEASKALG